MILFKDDWNKYPNAIVHMNTRNKSFLRQAGLYRKMNVDNHAFLLALHDVSLKDVDPYSEDLDDATIMKIMNECNINPWYYYREIARAPKSGGTVGFKFKANRGNISLFWLFHNHITSMLIQPRQTGKSFSTDTLMRRLLNVGSQNTKINLLTKDNKLRMENIQRLKDIESELPVYLRMTGKNDINNTEEISVKRLGNRYRTAIGQSSAKAAANVGRGLTSSIFHVDEIGHIFNIKETLSVALGSAGAARELAAANNAEYGTIFTTTAARLDSKSGAYAYKIYQEGAFWDEKFLDCKNITELRKIIRLHSSKDKETVILDFNHRQLGYTDVWLRERIEQSYSEGTDAEIDYLNIWSKGNNKSPIDKKTLDKMQASVVRDPFNEIDSSFGYITRWFVHESMIDKLVNTPMVIGLDTSDAVGKDDIAMIIRHAITGEVLAAGDFNETNLIDFSDWLVKLLFRFKKAVLIPERRSSGVTIIDYLLKVLPTKGMDPFKRIFNWVVEDAEVYKQRFNEIDVSLERRGSDLYTKYKKEFGFATSGSGRSSRDSLYGEALTAASKFTCDTVRDAKLVSQIGTLAIRNGRIDHTNGGNDDLCIAWLLSYRFLTHSANTNYYGIPQKDVLSRVGTNDKDVRESIKDKIEQKKIDDNKNLINYLMDALEKEKNDIKINMIIKYIRKLEKSIPDKDSNSLNINSKMETMERKRLIQKKVESRRKRLNTFAA